MLAIILRRGPIVAVGISITPIVASGWHKVRPLTAEMGMGHS